MHCQIYIFAQQTHICQTAAIICINPFTVIGSTGANPCCHLTSCQLIARPHRQTAIHARIHTCNAGKHLIISQTQWVTDFTALLFCCRTFAWPSAVQASPSRKNIQTRGWKNFRCTSINVYLLHFLNLTCLQLQGSLPRVLGGQRPLPLTTASNLTQNVQTWMWCTALSPLHQYQHLRDSFIHSFIF